MILVVNVCAEKLHYYEFVRPVENILRGGGFDFFIRGYLEIRGEDLERCDKVIICGTSLKDSFYSENLDKFDWLKDFSKPVFGICAGFQILGLVFGGKLKKKLEVGFFREKFEKKFLGLGGDVEVYHLHKNYVEFAGNFEKLVGEDFAQAVRWKNFCGVLFHPEVRNNKMILEFCEKF